MAHFVYIINSPSKDRFYVGETIDVKSRIEQHNSGFYTTSSTKIAQDWELFFQIECQNRTQALKLERFIKKMKSRQFYFRLVEESELVVSLLNRFR